LIADARAPRYRPVMAVAAISSPCIKVCAVDGESGLCLGCFRTLHEIGTWARLDESERQRIMAELPGRESAIDPRKLGKA
jgi:predicted Fe-S protein YdhL (DUF1289 family)